MQRVMPRATLRVIENVGHCPHLSSPSASSAAMDEFLASIGV
jgi:sigma-B regulation protein RsbQ